MSDTATHEPAFLPEISDSSPLGAVAVAAVEFWQAAGPGGVLILAGDERRAETLGACCHALASRSDPVVLPATDTLPYDGIRPSRTISGRRSSVLRRLAEFPDRPLVFATADAALQRVPAPGAWKNTSFTLRPGSAMDPDQLRTFLERAGYGVDARVDEAGEFVVHGQAVDVFPAGGLTPVRIGHADGMVTTISSYDPVTQRTSDNIEELVLDPMEETVVAPESKLQPGTLFDYLPGARLVIEHSAASRATVWLELLQEAFESRQAVPALRHAENAALAKPNVLYLTHKEWHEHLGKKDAILLSGRASAADVTVPRFCAESHAGRALGQYVEKQLESGTRLIFAAGDEAELARLERRARRAGIKSLKRAKSWDEAVQIDGKGNAAGLLAGFEAGFALPSRRIAVIAAADVLGSGGAAESPFFTEPMIGSKESLRFGDVVIHLERGAGILRALETVGDKGNGALEMVRMTFEGADVLLPVDQLGLVWKYAADRAIRLDRADGASWEKRRAELEGEITEAARKLVQLARQRAEASAPKLVPPPAEYERFVARFRYAATPDQARATADVLADLASGRPMDRLVSGDVGFGKTEVAMRAAAAAILSGAQVALAVPTTVLARQHFDTFSRRFVGLGIKIGRLSRLVPAAEQREVRRGLSDGSISLVIGTHAIAGKDVRFKQLGLVIVDEEQRFGERDKAKLRKLVESTHLLTLTATPIPRTLQLATAGLKQVSLLANPPARRLPVRTAASVYEPGTVRAALRHERNRAGQSFVVCPHIDDIGPWEERLQKLVPELARISVHGKMPAGQIDDSMMRFAAGEADILLATNIIESGLDLPRANTILVWRPDRFGLAQLHQLRGRVGRSDRRGYAYLISDSSAKEQSAAAKRLRAMEELTELGAGFKISRRDLDFRGAGDLFGENQTGHLKLVGPALYRHLLERALRTARGESVLEDYVPELRLDIAAAIPADYIPDEEVRLEIYERLAKARDMEDVHRLEEEIVDRFGAPPPPMSELVAVAELRDLSRRAGIARIDAGPRAIAITFRKPQAEVRFPGLSSRWSDGRLIVDADSDPGGRIKTVADLLRELFGS